MWNFVSNATEIQLSHLNLPTVWYEYTFFYQNVVHKNICQSFKNILRTYRDSGIIHQIGIGYRKHTQKKENNVFTSIKNFSQQYNFYIVNFGNVNVILQTINKWSHVFTIDWRICESRDHQILKSQIRTLEPKILHKK